MRELFRMDRHDYNPEGNVFERPSARAIVMKNGKVLLNYVSKYDCYEFPGGGIEAGETPEHAMRREVAEETGQVVVPESVREFGIVIRRQRDSKDPDGIFEQKNYYYLCDVTGETVPRKPDEHEILEGAKPVWVDSLALPIERNREAFERIGEPFIQRETRVMKLADEELRGQRRDMAEDGTRQGYKRRRDKMNHTYIIREAVPDDAEKMIIYLNQAGGESDYLLHGENEFHVPIEGVKRKLAMSKDAENSIVLIALENEQIIARAELLGYDAARMRHRAKFSISVKKEYWNQGIGTEMLKTIVAQAKKMNLKVIELEVITDNVRGIHLYHKMGFVDIGIYKEYFYVNGMFKDAVVMQKIL